jgi:hypothetical protein
MEGSAGLCTVAVENELIFCEVPLVIVPTLVFGAPRGSFSHNSGLFSLCPL